MVLRVFSTTTKSRLFDVPHYTPFHGLVLVLLSLDLQQQGPESLFAAPVGSSK